MILAARIFRVSSHEFGSLAGFRALREMDSMEPMRRADARSKYDEANARSQCEEPMREANSMELTGMLY